MQPAPASARLPGSAGLRWPTASLRAYLTVVIVVATLPIAGLLGLLLYQKLQDEQQRMRAELTRSAASIASVLERELLSSVDALATVSQSEALRQGDLATFERQARARTMLRSTWSGVFLADATGQVLFTTGWPSDADVRWATVGLDLANVARRGEPLASDLLAGGPQGPFVTAVAVPVMNGPEVRWVLGVWIPTSVWQDVTQRASGRPGNVAQVLDGRYNVIAQSAQPAAIGQPMPAKTTAALSAQAGRIARVPMPEGEESYTAVSKVPLSNWRVAVGVPVESMDAALRQAMISAAGIGLLGLLVGLMCALFVARRVTEPLLDLVRSPRPTRGAPIVVREIAQLHDALEQAARADEFARERQQRKADEFEALFRASPIGMAFTQDTQCRNVTRNPALTRMLGGLPDDGEITVWYRGQPLPPERQPLQLAAAQGKTVPAIELELRRDKGEPVFVLANAEPLVDASGQPRGAVGAMVDITERKRNEAKLLNADHRLRESQRLMDLAQEAGHVGFFHYVVADDALAWTPGQALLFGLGSESQETTLLEWVQRVAAEDRAHVEAMLRNALARGQEKETIDFRVRHGEDGWRWLSSRVLITYDQGRPQQMLGVTVDVTDQKLVERERAALVEHEQKARREAEDANRAKDEFLAMLAHELRNPLSAIASAVEVLNRAKSQAEIADDARRIIERQTRHLARLMDDLLDVSRLISGKILLSRAPVELGALVERIAATARVTGSGKEHEISVRADEVWVDADITRIEQVINNLLTNALKYTPAGGRIRFEVTRQDERACLALHDDGVGIPPELLPRVFDLFVQGERSIDRRAGGLGIGLTLVRRLVEMHGGSVHVESGPEGSSFYVHLPTIDRPAGLAESTRIAPGLRRRVLLVEDNDDTRVSLQEVLRLDGHEVQSCGDGTRGLDMLLEQRPDVAVIDIGLPGMSGYELARESRLRGYTGRLIALSGYGQARDIRQAREAGFDAHLVKPVELDALRALMIDKGD
ncbi:ATP-binding protein [Caldimonas sp. KR1-144]|uniref:hybrid sensor histidine kinase/response regulator n=1 Tax=Caldimonas sp. KR1-144 TaxID=3400911 RepID=UPI003C0BBCA7